MIRFYFDQIGRAVSEKEISKVNLRSWLGHLDGSLDEKLCESRNFIVSTCIPRPASSSWPVVDPQ